MYRLFFEEDEATSWIIGSLLGSGDADSNYYGVVSSNDTPEGLTMMYDYSLGSPPYPLIAPVISGPECISVRNAGTAEVNGNYTNMGTHPTDSDGVDYYKKDDIYLYRRSFEGIVAWIIGTELGGVNADYNYYAVLSSNDTPEGLTMVYHYSLGDSPPPSLKECNTSISGVMQLLLD